MKKICVECKVEKDISEFNKRSDSKDGLFAKCKICKHKVEKEYRLANKALIAERSKSYREANSELIKARNKAYEVANKEAISEKRKAYRKANPELFKARSKAYEAANKEVISQRRKLYRARNAEKVSNMNKSYYYSNLEKTRSYKNNWAKNNPENGCRNYAKRRAQKLQATPKWDNELNDFILKEIYHLSKLRTEMLEVQHHVDHIVPLKHNLVCGLHVANNLQILIGVENMRKGNRYWPDMP